MPDLRRISHASTFGVRQVSGQLRVKAAAAGVGLAVESQFEELIRQIEQSKSKRFPDVAEIVRKNIDQMLKRSITAVGAHLDDTAKWGYDSAADAFLNGSNGEQLDWIALGRMNASKAENLVEQQINRFDASDGLAVLRRLITTRDQIEQLNAVAQSLGFKQAAAMMAALMNAMPQGMTREQIADAAVDRVRIAGGHLAKEDFNPLSPVGRIGVGAPSSLKDWWESGFHEMSDQQKRDVLKQYVFPPPSIDKIKSWTERDRNVFGNDGMSWEDRLKKTSKLITDTDAMSHKIASIVSQGGSMADVRKAILADVNNYKVSAERIARMEVQRVLAETNEAVYDENEDVIDGMQMNAVLDALTRPAHAARNGRIWWKRDEAAYAKRPSLPDDYNCRCYWSPVLKPPIGIEHDPDMAKAYETAAGPVIDPLIYQQWWEKASRIEKEFAVGSRRYATVEKKLGKDVAPTFYDFIDKQGNLLPLSKVKKMTRDDLLANRQDNQQVAAELADLLQQIRKKSFLIPKPEEKKTPVVEPKPVGPVIEPAPGMPAGWLKQTIVGKDGKSRTIYISPDDQRFASAAKALAYLAELAQKAKAAAEEAERKKQAAQAGTKTAEQIWQGFMDAVSEAGLDQKDYPARVAAARQELENASLAYHKKKNDETRDAYGVAMAKYNEVNRELTDAQRESARKLLIKHAKASDPMEIKLDMIGTTAKEKSDIEKANMAKEFIAAMMERKAKVHPDTDVKLDRQELGTIKVERERGNRSSAAWWYQKVSMSKSADVKTWVHEFGHLFEGNIRIRQAANAFLNKRTGFDDSDPKRAFIIGSIGLKKVLPNYNYRANEKTRPGWAAFMSMAKGSKNTAAYAAKVYDLQPFQRGVRSTELISIGLEELFDDPVGFAKADREYFCFLINVLRGEL